MPFDASAPAEVTARDRMIQLRDHLASLPPEEFDMGRWHCGTTHCIGGWVENLFCQSLYSSTGEVGAVIGLSHDNASKLFYPPNGPAYNADPSQAVAVIDHYLATGVIDWSIILPA